MRLLQVCRINLARFSTISRTSPTATTIQPQNVKSSITNCDEVNSITPIFKQALTHNKRTALKDRNGEFTYFDLVAGSNKLSSEISDICGKFSFSFFLSQFSLKFLQIGKATNARVAYLCPNDASHVVTQWAAFMSGQIAGKYFFFKDPTKS